MKLFSIQKAFRPSRYCNLGRQPVFPAAKASTINCCNGRSSNPKTSNEHFHRSAEVGVTGAIAVYDFFLHRLN
jgi:hypothetical protein